MRWLRGMAAATAALAAMMGAMVVTPSSAAAYQEGCTEKPGLLAGEYLQPGQALCTENYQLRMQEDGNLVLREILSGRACWHSNTFVAGESATFEPGTTDRWNQKMPKLTVGESEIWGRNWPSTGRSTEAGASAYLTSRGVFYIGFLDAASC